MKNECNTILFHQTIVADFFVSGDSEIPASLTHSSYTHKLSWPVLGKAHESTHSVWLAKFFLLCFQVGNALHEKNPQTEGQTKLVKQIKEALLLV